MRVIVIVAVIFAANAARADPFEGFYGNTGVSKMADGEVMTYFFNPDGSFESHFAGGKVVKGTFRWKDPTTACFLPTEPAPPPGTKSVCRAYPVTHHVGDTWTEKANGADVVDSLVAGRQ